MEPFAQDPLLGYRAGAHDATLSYNAVPASKNNVSLQGSLRKKYTKKSWTLNYASRDSYTMILSAMQLATISKQM